jgi:NAD(P)-dependent dehydrogenase (short-subunit alcohol dehydrogenase family)
VGDSGGAPDFGDKVALVTGAASGIGAASARHLASLGAHVVAIDLAEVGVRALADEIAGTAAVLDVADPAAWEDLVRDVCREYGSIDLAHLNAGIVTTPHPYRVADVTVAQYRRVVGVNLDGMLLPVLALAPVMEGRGGGAIVCTASLAGLGPYYDDPFYAATKHAVVGFVRSAAPQLATGGVHIHAICPGGVQTALIDDFIQQRLTEGDRPTLDPAEVAVAVADMLASEETGLVRTIVKGKGVQDFEFRRGVMPPP